MARLCRPVLLFACLPLLHGCGGQRPSVESKQAADTSPRPQASVATQSSQSSPARPDTSRLDSVPQGPHAELRGGDYIQSVFQEKVGESPRMGWFLSTRFLAAEKHQHVYIYSNRAVIDTAVFE